MSKVSPGLSSVNVQPGGTPSQLGKTATETAVGCPVGVSVAGGVGVPVASGIGGRGVLVGVAFRFVMATAIGEGKICRCRLSTCARSKASSTVNKTPPVSSRWMRQLPGGVTSGFIMVGDCCCCRLWACLGRIVVPERRGRARKRCYHCPVHFLPKDGRRGCW